MSWLPAEGADCIDQQQTGETKAFGLKRDDLPDYIARRVHQGRKQRLDFKITTAGLQKPGRVKDDQSSYRVLYPAIRFIHTELLKTITPAAPRAMP